MRMYTADIVQIQSKTLVKSIHWYGHRAKKTWKKIFEKDLFKVMNYAVFGKNYEECDKT